MSWKIYTEYNNIKPAIQKKILYSNILHFDYEWIKKKAKITTLNHHMPTFEDFVQYINTRGKSEIKGDNINYYEKVVEYMPYRADAHGLLAFCHYHLGEHEKAISSYQKAIKINPHFFWFHYNLGVIYFKQGRFDQSIESLKRSLGIRPEISLQILISSKLFMDIIIKGGELDNALDENLKTGYHDAYTLLILGYYHLQDFPQMFNNAVQALQWDLDPTGLYHFYAGVAAYHLMNYGESVSFFKEYIRINPESADAHFYLGLNLKALDQEKTAAQFLQQAAFLHQNNPSSLLNIDDIQIQIF